MRPAYGVSFAQISTVEFGASYWTHVFAIAFPQIPTPAKLAPTSCKMPDVEGLCNELRNLTRTLRLGHQTSLETALQHLREFRRIILAEIKSTHRSKRALFGFIGQIAKSLFAVVTEDDTQKIAAQIHQVESGLHSAQDEIVKNSETLSSLVRTTDTRLTNAVSGIENNHRLLSQLSSNAALSNYLIFIMRNALVSTDHYFRLELLAESWLASAETLLSGYLPLQLVAPAKLRTVLSDLAASLSTSHPNW